MPFVVENHSPFPHRAFVKTGPDGTEFAVLVVRATFDWVHNGEMTVAREQEQVLLADQLDGPREDGALRLETDLVIGKPRADILVVGHAHAPLGARVSDWVAVIEVGRVSKAMRVTGPRFWEKGAFGFRLSRPEPVDRVPLSYRIAFGGTRRSQSDDSKVDSFEANPVGIGYAGRFPITEARWPAPQTETVDTAIGDPASRPPPEGFGPIARSWAPRHARAGALTPEFVRNNPGKLPPDFDWGFYNSASRGLIYPEFLQGDETISTQGLFPEGRSASRLPGYRPLAVAEVGHAVPLRLTPNLDTLVVDTDARRATVTFRLTTPRELAVTGVILGFSVPPLHGAGPSPISLKRRS